MSRSLRKPGGSVSDARPARLDVALACICLALIPALWLSVFRQVAFEREEAVGKQRIINDNLALAFEEHVARTLAQVDQSLLVLRHELLQQGEPSEIAGGLIRGLFDASIYTYIGAIDRRGRLVMGKPGYKPLDVTDRDYFHFHKDHDGDRMFLGQTIVGRITGRPGIQFTRRVFGPDGSFGGIVYVSVDATYFTRFYERAELGADGLVLLVGLDGYARLRQAGTTSTFGGDLRRSSLIAAQAVRPVGNFVSNGTVDGVRRHVSYRTLKDYPLVVAVGTAEDAVMHPLKRRASIFHATGAAVTVLILAVALALRRLLLETAARRRNESELRDSESLLWSALKEREQLSRDLHDGILQSIYAVGLCLEHARRLVATRPQAAGQHIAEAVDQLNGVIRDVRKHIAPVVSPVMDTNEFYAELEKLVHWVAGSETMRVRLFAQPDAVRRLSPHFGHEVINVLREAVSNSVRHSGAREVHIRVERQDDGVRVAVVDDGAGFDTGVAQAQGYGLKSMAARAANLSADLAIRSSPGGGTRVILTIPAGAIHD